MKLFTLFFSLLGSSVAAFFGRFLGSEEMVTSINLFLFALFLFCLIFLFRRHSFRLKEKYGSRLVLLMYFSLLFGISLLGAFLRI